MAGLKPLSSPKPNPSTPSLCDECSSNPWKYRCPGCSIKSCSLPCVKSHKARTSCSGKRNRTEFVSLSQFDDSILISDYSFLEETKRAAESARRMGRDMDGFREKLGYKLPKSLLMLRSAAQKRKTKLLLLPPGMLKRKTNRSRYECRKNSILWTIEWRFNATDVVLLDHWVDENVSLSSAIAKHLAPTPLKDQLTSYRNVHVDDLKCFLRKTPKGVKSPFRELNIKAPLGGQLAGVVILEYPVIFVFLPSHKHEFEVEKDTRTPPPKKEELPGSLHSQLSPKGNLFVEEEIEEGEVFSDTLVTDLMGRTNSVTSASIGTEQEKVGHVLDMQMSKEATNGSKSNSDEEHLLPSVHEAKRNCGDTGILQNDDVHSSRTLCESSKPFSSQRPAVLLTEKAEMGSSTPVNSWKPPAEANFDFQQELRDAYSDLIGEINPDDFLCLDGGFNELDNLEKFLMEEELEEGEIPAS